MLHSRHQEIQGRSAASRVRQQHLLNVNNRHVHLVEIKYCEDTSRSISWKQLSNKVTRLQEREPSVETADCQAKNVIMQYRTCRRLKSTKDFCSFESAPGKTPPHTGAKSCSSEMAGAKKPGNTHASWTAHVQMKDVRTTDRKQ